MEDLLSEQQTALSQLRELTNGADDEVAVSVLSSVDWDVQRAAELIFGAASTPKAISPSSHSPSFHTFNLDDSGQGDDDDGHERPLAGTVTWLYTSARSMFTFLAFPLHVLSNALRFIFSILRIPFPSLRFAGLRFYRPLQPRPTARRGPDKWLRELEEDTGAVSIGRLKIPRGTSSSFNGDAGPSTLTSRSATSSNGNAEDGRRLLPDFTVGPYEEVLLSCQRDPKIACVILVSEEHDDVPEFKRLTLTDPTFVKALYNNDIVVWGGDVRDQEAWSAAEKLQATTYPFIAFMALQPRRNIASSSSSRTASPPTLTVLSRHQGKCLPAGAPTSAQALVEHLERQVLPRVSPFLERIRVTQRDRERDRQLRDDQDRAFQDSARRDKERIEAKIAAEKVEAETRQRALDRQRNEIALREQQAEIQSKKEAVRMDWRRWTRRLINAKSNSHGTLRIAIRFPSGERLVHQFSDIDTLTSLYSLVDSTFIPSQFQTTDDPSSPPQGSDSDEDALESYISTGNPSEYWGFTVASAYPRVEIPWQRGIHLHAIKELQGGGQVVVEMTDARRRSNDSIRQNQGQGDDGYSTEEDD